MEQDKDSSQALVFKGVYDSSQTPFRGEKEIKTHHQFKHLIGAAAYSLRYDIYSACEHEYMRDRFKKYLPSHLC